MPETIGDMTIRRADVADAQILLQLIERLNAHLGMQPTGKSTQDMAEAMARHGATLFAFIAEIDGNAVGYALGHDAFTSDVVEWGVYMADLFVDKEHRGKGIGRALVDCVASEADKRGATHIFWVSHDANRDAQAVYKAFGAIEEPVRAHALIRDAFKEAAERGGRILVKRP